MAKAEKAADASKPIADVAHPGTTAPSDTSKAIINQRPMIKDPMVVEETVEGAETPLTKKTGETKIEPPKEAASTASEPEPKPAKSAEPAEKDDAEAPKPEKESGKKGAKGSDAEAAEAAAQNDRVEKLIESKKYFLPINAVEHRRSKQIVIAGVVLAILLALAWVNIALDAGIIQVEGIKPVTHFFSS